MDKNLRAYVAELVGTFALVFVGAGVVCANQWALMKGVTQPHLLGIAVAEGLILAAGLAATLHLSGGYLNPAVTITLWACKRLDGAKASGLVFVQLLGAALAGGLVRLLFGFDQILLGAVRLGTPHVNLRVFDVTGPDFRTRMSGMGIEAVLTFVLTFVIFATTIDPRAPRLLGKLGQWLSGLWVGLTMAAVALAGFPFTGAAANPARWFGTVIWEKSLPVLQLQDPFADYMVYLIGPILGAVIAGGLYTLLVLPQEAEHKATGMTATTGAKVAAGHGSTLFRAKK
jgi:MIP family channel proteins